jgi:DNA-binding MarR family transcriptional regulator
MPEKSEYVPTNSISVLQEKALDLIGSRSDGVFQSDLRRLLGIDSSKCSKVVTRMKRSGLIYREKVPASSTYLIKLVHASAAPAFDEKDAAAEVQRGHIESHVGSHMESKIDSILDGKNNRQVVSYFDCNIDGYIDSDIGSQIDSYFDSQRSTDSHSHIDSFLTEIYLLYMVRGISG